MRKLSLAISFAAIMLVLLALSVGCSRMPHYSECISAHPVTIPEHIRYVPLGFGNYVEPQQVSQYDTYLCDKWAGL